MYSTFARERNEVEELEFTQKDLENAVADHKKLELTESDANGMIEYFNKTSADNQNFFHLCRFGKDGALQDVVWVDARSRAAYEEFSDVVCFDSTYLTDKFHLPFVVFIGVNHHGQSILLGCALISWETAETYMWVMRTWLHFMGGKAPISILTDLDALNRKAVYVTISAGLYDERNMWIPSYLKHFFWAGMKTTQRSESFNHFFKGYVDKNTTLSEFVLRYCDAMQIWAEAERIADANTLRYVKHLATDFLAEELFQKCYTDSKIKEVQRECTKSLYVHCSDQIELCENNIEFILEDCVWIKPKGARKESGTKIWRCYKVLYDAHSCEACCDCKHFECHGIICRHMNHVYDLNSEGIVPEKYVLRRWRKDVQRKHTRVKVAYLDPLKTDEVRQFRSLNLTS
ncbi:protein FAR-RED IMPAIRED RESPONSE 1-like [Chenopodium quinoa]|uniref:protein FAR-RED IMPAIRED RESPONSE 1-like n=1 Tax=Chenopodium quinoa TaxID=63459 RepID=UPI000B78E0B7|nr:protein FAR-RED IMPAIRED RESPONSE 1-like [Chenopodium quinoa]